VTDTGKLISLLFYSGEPIKSGSIESNLGLDAKGLSELVNKANQSLASSGLFIIANEGELQLTVLSNYTEMIEEFYKVSPQGLSQPSLEVLSIIAYKQPISKGNIDEIRGVGSDQSIKNLLNKGLIKKSKHQLGPVYTTTTEFLKIAGIKSIKELHGPND